MYDSCVVGGVFNVFLFRNGKRVRPLLCFCDGEGDTASVPDSPGLPRTARFSWWNDVDFEGANLYHSVTQSSTPSGHIRLSTPPPRCSSSAAIPGRGTVGDSGGMGNFPGFEGISLHWEPILGLRDWSSATEESSPMSSTVSVLSSPSSAHFAGPISKGVLSKFRAAPPFEGLPGGMYGAVQSVRSLTKDVVEW